MATTQTRPKFDKQGHEALALLLARARRAAEGSLWGGSDEHLEGIAGFQSLLIDTLEQDNPRFDRQRFIEIAHKSNMEVGK